MNFWPTMKQLLDSGLDEKKAKYECSKIQSDWAQRVIADCVRTIVYPNGPPGQLPAESWWSDVHAQWSQLTRNVDEFTDHVGDGGKYQSWPLVVKLLQGEFRNALLDHLHSSYRGVYTFDEMDQMLPPAVPPMLSNYDRLGIMYRYMEQMQMRKDRGAEWCELMVDIATQMTILSENTP